MSNQLDFLKDIDPKKKPDKPEQFPEDYEDNLEDNCPVCGNQLGVHTTREIVQCALNELRGEPQKGKS